MIEIKWKKLKAGAQVPGDPETPGSACFDLRACLSEGSLAVRQGEVTVIPTGLAVEIPIGYEMQVRARSGLAFRYGFTLVNGVGTIDADYRGEIMILASLLSRGEYVVQHGDRIAQALISPVLKIRHLEVSELSGTSRGEGGFGSTGQS